AMILHKCYSDRDHQREASGDVRSVAIADRGMAQLRYKRGAAGRDSRASEAIYGSDCVDIAGTLSALRRDGLFYCDGDGDRAYAGDSDVGPVLGASAAERSLADAACNRA